MKRLFILPLLIGIYALGAYASEWGLLPQAVSEATDNASSQNTPHTAQKFLLRPILDGKPVYFFVRNSPQGKEEAFEKEVPLLFQTWFERTLQFIRDSGNEADFEDLIPLLQRGADMRPAGNEEEARIIFNFIPLKEIQQICENSAAGCLKIETDTPEIYIPTDKTFMTLTSFGMQTPRTVGLHETGHALGLSDQYLRARSYNSDEIFHAPSAENSIMNTASDITCDDATGLINAIDLVLGSTRIRKGLCETDFREYRGGTTFNKMGFRFNTDDFRRFTVETYQDGTRSKVQTFDLDLHNDTDIFETFSPAEVLLGDGNNRPLKAVGKNGETLYFAYVYDRTTQLVLQNGKVKQINRDFRNPKATRNQVRRNRSLIFASNGKVCMLEGFVYADKSSQVVFTEGITPSADKADLLVEKQVTRTFDSKGELVMNLWQESKDRKFPLLSEEKPVDQNAFSDLFALDRSSKPDPKRKELIQRMDEWLHQLQK